MQFSFIMQPSSIFLIYVQPRQKKLIISHKLTIGENFKLLNDINILQEEICEKQMLPNHSPTIVLLGYCPSLWNTPSDKMVNHVPFFGLCLSLRQHNHWLWDGLFNSCFFSTNESLPQPLPGLE
jgi:hypothetical protein